MVAQQVLVLYVRVRVLAGQPLSFRFPPVFSDELFFFSGLEVDEGIPWAFSRGWVWNSRWWRVSVSRVESRRDVWTFSGS